MADEQQPVRRRFSWSYLFSFLLIAGIIITVIVLGIPLLLIIRHIFKK